MQRHLCLKGVRGTYREKGCTMKNVVLFVLLCCSGATLQAEVIIREHQPTAVIVEEHRPTVIVHEHPVVIVEHHADTVIVEPHHHHHGDVEVKIK